MAPNKSSRRGFYVVQFMELPFEGINDYVCIPYTWMIKRRATDHKAIVAYPNDEDPFDTRDRVKRQERYSDEWRFYAVTVRYESGEFNSMN